MNVSIPSIVWDSKMKSMSSEWDQFVEYSEKAAICARNCAKTIRENLVDKNKEEYMDDELLSLISNGKKQCMKLAKIETMFISNFDALNTVDAEFKRNVSSRSYDEIR